MSYYRECPYCHAHLDPGEACDCRAEEPPDEPPVPEEEPAERDCPED